MRRTLLVAAAGTVALLTTACQPVEIGPSASGPGGGAPPAQSSPAPSDPSSPTPSPTGIPTPSPSPTGTPGPTTTPPPSSTTPPSATRPPSSGTPSTTVAPTSTGAPQPTGTTPPGTTPPGTTPPGTTPPGTTPPGTTPPTTSSTPQPPTTTTPPPTSSPPAPSNPGRGSAAERFGWGTPTRSDDFTAGLGPDWSIYDGPGHAGNGRRSPSAVSVRDGVLTINGDAAGTTAGMAWNPGQRYGRWEVRMRAPVSDPSYNALALLWPDAEDFPVGGEVDFVEMTDHTRQTTEMFLHYGPNNSQVHGSVRIDATQWHDWAVEWTPQHVVAYVDGVEWFRSTDPRTIPPRAMHLCLQLDWFPKGGAVRPSSMSVDWVRQYGL